jgi:hypothetical protein
MMKYCAKYINRYTKEERRGEERRGTLSFLPTQQ